MLTREDCVELDQQDDLSDLRSKFHLPEGIIYLDGNSLGAMPKGAVQKLSHTIEEEWANGLIKSWTDADWFTLPGRLGDRLGRLIGAGPGQTLVCDGTSINIYKALRAAMALRPDRSVIVSEKDSFPTDLYISEGAMSARGGMTRRLLGQDSDALEDLIDDQVAVVLLSNVDYRTGRMVDMAKVTKMAHDAGAMVIWDLCHTAGIVPMDLDAIAADFAVGCTYKYLSGGPGAPAFIYVAKRHQDKAVQPLSGWWGHADPFAFDHEYSPASGIGRFLVGTQGILGLRGVEAALDLFDQIDLAKVREKSKAMGDLFIKLVEQNPDLAALDLVSPRDAEQRGSHVSLYFRDGYPVVRAMIEQGVIGDFREPGIMRFGFAPFYLRFVDLFDSVEVMADCMRRKVWTDSKYLVREAVT